MTEAKTPKKKTITEMNGAEDVKLEEAMRRLDEVVSALDRENTDLEEALKLYQEGVRLVSLCNRKLEDARRTIEILKISPDGEITQEPFAHENKMTKE
ncbi:MAG: exodeoxyribonuclease VII small subunit [Clostridia bacterium]|nr:exodeoxyribonuclease VII small subunit [Clostridia bacterium]